MSGSDPPTAAGLGDDRHLAEVAMHIQRYGSHSVLLTIVELAENRCANDIDGSALAAQPGGSQGAATKAWLQHPSRKTAHSACVLPAAVAGGSGVVATPLTTCTLSDTSDDSVSPD
jgi:hypothetical protein